MRRTVFGVGVALIVACAAPALGQSRPLRLQASTGTALRAGDALVDSMLRDGALRVTQIDPDHMLPDRRTERLQQFYRGVPIFGADLVRDSSPQGTEALYGTVYRGLALSTDAAISPEEAGDRLRALVGDRAALLKPIQLTILPMDDGRMELAYTSVVAASSTVARVFVSARDGAELLRIDEIHTQSAVGRGHGVLGDQKKISVLSDGGTFVADDRLRPPQLVTFDMRGNFLRALTVLNGAVLLNSDRAADSDNDWTDPAVVDAHVHIGWTYDYIHKRFGRRGLDDRNRPILILTNAVTQEGALTLSGVDFAVFAVNAFWCGACGPDGIGLMNFGNGIPSNYYLAATGQSVTYLAGALDVTAHELTHGVTESSSRLIARGESGALDEAFSDILGTSAEFFYQAAGGARGQADYLIGEDAFRAFLSGSGNGIRSMSNPAAFGDPDHYSRRYLGADDNGGVHWNSGIPNHAFYLAIEGGTDRTSRRTVQGVGAANREQIEKAFFRAFVQLLPSNATFATARAATIQAARDLYGAASPAERAITQAWTAVGVY